MNENLRLLKPLFRGSPIVILVMVLAVFSAKKYLNYVTPMYESTAKIKLADVHEGISNANLYKDLDLFASTNKIASEIEVLKSSSLLKKVLDKLPFKVEIFRKGAFRLEELYNKSPILIEGTFGSDKAYDKRYSLDVVSDKEFIYKEKEASKSFKGQFGRPFTINEATFLITLNQDYLETKRNTKIIDRYEFEFLSDQKLMDKIETNLDIVPVDKDVPVIRINFKSNIPEKAAIFVNTLAESYIQDYIENKFNAANITVEFLKSEITESNKRLKESEDNIQKFRDDNNIINFTQENETNLRKISQLKIQQTNLRMSLDAIKQLNTYIDKGKFNYLELAPNFEAFTDLLSTEMVKAMKKLQADKKDLLLTYTPENEKVKIVDQKMQDLIDYQIESIKNTERNLQIKYNELTQDIEEAQKVFVGIPEKEKMLAILNREFNLYENNYNFLNGKRIDAEIAKSAKIAFHKIITFGSVSKTPISPIRIIIIIVAAILGMFGSIVLIYLVHFAKAKVNDEYTIEKNGTIPIALSTPYIKNRTNLKENFLKEAMKLELKEMIKPRNILTFTSFDKVSHHEFHAINMAKAFMQQGRKVLLVDVTGHLKSFFDDENYVDFSDKKYLSYTKNHFQAIIDLKMSDYDLCIVHNQAIVSEKLALMFMSLANHNLFVVDSRKTPEKRIVLIELLRDEYTLPNLWFVLNKAGYNPNVVIEVKDLIIKFININLLKKYLK